MRHLMLCGSKEYTNTSFDKRGQLRETCEQFDSSAHVITMEVLSEM